MQSYRPAGQLLVTCCNMGYARGECDRVPADAQDAVRFAYAERGVGPWVLEAVHRPVAHGVSEPGSLAEQGTVLGSQVNAYRRAIEEQRPR